MSVKLGNFHEYLEKKNYSGLPNENLTPYQFLQPIFPSPYEKVKECKQS
jgi:hypothetical protein